ncbi:peptidoglycan-binding protein [Mesorhizobium sp. 1B3]|uniref:peptidoglycan-binding protein n=1 Tax=Mesorhizobium sp. 1B3 TaxID=3243599 RepID=UPI003D95C8A3
MKIISVVILSTITMVTDVAFASPSMTGEAIDSATFEEWRKRRQIGSAVLEIDPQTGEVEVSDNPLDEKPGSAEDAQVPVPGQPDVVVETPQESTDVPDEAQAQIKADPNVLEEAEKKAEQAQGDPDPFLVRLQILLDRAHVSPGVIDGFLGQNTRKAIAAYEELRGLPVDGEPDAQTWATLAKDGEKPTRTYEIAADDINGRYGQAIPDAEPAKAQGRGYRDAVEKLSEKFHIDDDLLRRLNPKADFTAAGSKLLVPALGPEPTAKIARMEVDMSEGELRAYDAENNIVLFSPASVGDTRFPGASLTVVATSPTPTSPQAPSKKQAVGPNGPDGSMWIELSDPAFAIHGTAVPEAIGKSPEQGGVELTNWDVRTLASSAEPGKTVVEFRD